MADGAPRKVLFAHTPKAAGVHLIDYFERELRYPRIQSDGRTDDGVWLDFTIRQLLERTGADHAFLNTHVLAFGWSALVEIIPFAEKEKIVEAIRTFRSNGWFTFTFVRHRRLPKLESNVLGMWRSTARYWRTWASSGHKDAARQLPRARPTTWPS